MEFNLLTFCFEIINFFVLLLILKKLLYQPIIQVLQDRQTLIEEQIQQAEVLKKDASKLKEAHQQYIEETENRKKEQIELIQLEVEQARNKQWKKLQAELTQEKQKHQNYLEIKERETANQIRESVINTALGYSTKILKLLTDEHLHQRLIEMALKALEKLPPEEIHIISQELKEHGKVILISPMMLKEEQFSQIKTNIEKILGFCPHFTVDIEPELQAGIQLHMGTKLLNSTLSGNLDVFKSLLHEKVYNHG